MKILSGNAPRPAALLVVAALVGSCADASGPRDPTEPAPEDRYVGGSSNGPSLASGAALAGTLAFPTDAGPPPDVASPADAAAPLADPSDRLLAFGSAETLVGGITAAEDVMFSTDDRLFVTGNDGVYELTRDASGRVQATNLLPGQTGIFTGIAEVSGTLYVTGTDYSNSYLYAASLAGAPPAPDFRKIYTMKTTILANEMAADPAGRLYVAASLQGQILRLELSSTDPFTVAAQEEWLSTPTGIFPNGLKYDGSSIYWTDSLAGTVSQTFILSGGAAGPISTFVDPDDGFFDDLHINANRTVLVASYLLGYVRAYGPPPLGGLLAQTPPGAFKNPADVLPARGRLGFGSNDLLVTDKGANSVVLFHVPQ